MNHTVAVILGGGKGTRLHPLTKERAKPAVPIAGRYRLIDIPISNCINSNLRKIYVLTMFQSASLNRHISNTYRFDQFSGGFVQVLAAEQSGEEQNDGWFQGTADAVRKSMRHLHSSRAQAVLVLSGDHLYRMDYADFAAKHNAAHADISIAVKPVTRQEAPELGLLKIDETGRIVKFVEKPKTDEALDALTVDQETLSRLFGLNPADAAARPFLASMGIYYFNTPTLQDALFADPSMNDFGKEIIPAIINDRLVHAYCFSDYWADIGTIRAFYDANMDLVNPLPRFNLFDPVRPVYTHNRFLPGAKISSASVESSVLCDGVIVEKATVRDSLLGVRCRVRSSAYIESSLVMGSDFYQPGDESAPFVGIDEGAHIRRAIIDKNARIGRDVNLVNRQGHEHYDHPDGLVYVRDGIICVPKGAVIPSGFVF